MQFFSVSVLPYYYITNLAAQLDRWDFMSKDLADQSYKAPVRRVFRLFVALCNHSGLAAMKAEKALKKTQKKRKKKRKQLQA